MAPPPHPPAPCDAHADNAIVSGPYIDYVADPRPAYQSSQFSFDPSRTVATYAVNGKVDDDYNVNGIQSTDYGDYYPWWWVRLHAAGWVWVLAQNGRCRLQHQPTTPARRRFVDLGEGAMVTGIQVYNRHDLRQLAGWRACLACLPVILVGDRLLGQGRGSVPLTCVSQFRVPDCRYDCCADRLVDMEFRIGDADPTVPMGSLITANPLLVKYPGPPVLGNGQVWHCGGRRGMGWWRMLCMLPHPTHRTLPCMPHHVLRPSLLARPQPPPAHSAQGGPHVQLHRDGPLPVTSKADGARRYVRQVLAQRGGGPGVRHARQARVSGLAAVELVLRSSTRAARSSN